MVIIIATIIVISVIVIRKMMLNKEDPFSIEPQVGKNLSLPCELNPSIIRAEEFIMFIKQAQEEYFRNSHKEQLKERYKDLYEELSGDYYSNLDNNIINEFLSTFSNINSLVKEWNSIYIKKEMVNNSDLFNDIYGNVLDEQQRTAVLVDEDNNIIISGAGSGKTLIIAAKVKYLADTKHINPKEILLISYTKKSAKEMEERIKNKLGIDIEAITFHKLGLDIISQDKDERPEVSDKLSEVINEYFKEEIIKNQSQVCDLIKYMGIYFNIPKNLEEFDSMGEIYDYFKSFDRETLLSKSKKQVGKKNTLKGEIVKSIEETLIANFLFLNGVKYEYEKIYPFNVAGKYRKKYRPDFYLTEYDIYLEHFGITKNHKVPWLDEIEEKKYLEGIAWKRNVHEKHGTKLIETYSFYNDFLLDELNKILKSCGVICQEINFGAVYERVYIERQDRFFSEFKKMVETFITLYKSNGYTENDFDRLYNTFKTDNLFLRERTRLFLSVVKPIYLKYQETLSSSGEIDFNDMINMAVNIVSAERIRFSYKYIIIDEYQDISKSRFELVKSLKIKTDAKVMAVGDDWQSIYRFAGSDIDLFTNFDKNLGYSEKLKIERTYRNGKELIDVASSFVNKNPKQIKKELKSGKRYENPIKIFDYEDDLELGFINAIDQIVAANGEKTEMMIIGRNNFDIDFLKRSSKLKLSAKNNIIKYEKYPNVKLFYTTAHASKGLEAENVIVINLTNKLLGFPNKIVDDPILSLVLTDADTFPFAEERRLFYVALTRTKNMVCLVVPARDKSIFVEELIKSFNLKCLNSNGKHRKQSPSCPACKTGVLLLRNADTPFLGCSNYPLCTKTLKNIEILNSPVKCPNCNGYVVVRQGKNGEFFGCTNYPECRYNKIADNKLIIETREESEDIESLGNIGVYNKMDQESDITEDDEYLIFEQTYQDSVLPNLFRLPILSGQDKYIPKREYCPQGVQQSKVNVTPFNNAPILDNERAKETTINKGKIKHLTGRKAGGARRSVEVVVLNNKYSIIVQADGYRREYEELSLEQANNRAEKLIDMLEIE